MKFILVVLLVLVYSNANAWSDKDKTHKLISEYVLTHYFTPEQYNISINGNSFQDWILLGADLEDQGTKIEFVTGKARSLNHFHTPTKPLSSAGLNDIALPYLYGESALAWAQDGATQSTKAGGDWSWQKVKDHYYTYLTTSDKTPREVAQSEYLKGLGYQLHSIQDMSQPNHARNDTHMADGDGDKKTYGFESWAKDHPDFIKSVLNSGPIPTVTVDLKKPFADISVAPVSVARLFDTREHLTGGVISPSASMDQGLSEFTNTNFFSEDTTFADGFSTSNDKYFPYPAKSETNLQSYIDNTLNTAPVTDSDGSNASYFKISKQNTTGVPLSCLAKAGPNSKKYYTEFGEGAAFYKSFRVDDECFEEYSQHLFPRAVAYSKALLDYFFRGTIGITAPASGVYGTAPLNGTFNEIRLNAVNSSATGELMSNGTIQLIVKYKLAATDPYQSAQVAVGQETYIIVPEKNGKTTIPPGTPTELVFDLSMATPNPASIPLWATNVYLQVVFKGQLGNESNAVAVGFADISEPTPVDVYNNTDYVCLNNQWYHAGSAAALAITDTNNDGKADRTDIYPHNISNIGIQFGPAGSAPQATLQHNNLFSSPVLAPGQSRRLGYVLADYPINFGSIETWTKISSNDQFSDVIQQMSPFTGQGFIMQTGLGYGVMYKMRGIDMWWGAAIIFENSQYPDNAYCDDSLLPIP